MRHDPTSMFADAVSSLCDLSKVNFTKRKDTNNNSEISFQKRISRGIRVYVTEMNLLLKTRYEKYLEVCFNDGKSTIFDEGAHKLTPKSFKKRWVVLDVNGLTYCKSGSRTKSKGHIPMTNVSSVLLYLMPEKCYGRTYPKEYKSNCIMIYSHDVKKNCHFQ